MKVFIFILNFSILTMQLFSCKKDNNCPNRRAITQFGKPDIILKLNYNQDWEALIQEIENHFKEDICWIEKTIGLRINDQVLKTIFLKTCILKGTGYGMKHRSEVRILQNQKGELLVNEEYSLKPDSLSDWIGKNFPNQNFAPYSMEEISILWHKETPKEEIENVLLQIKEGYKKSYERISIEKFNKELCNLKIDEFNQLRKVFEFRIKLGFGKIIPPIPPPPSIE